MVSDLELNYDFVRDLLLFIAQNKNYQGPTSTEVLNFADSKRVTKYQLAFTIEKLYEARFITDHVMEANNKPKIFTTGNLTYYGNQYLDTIRNNSTWEKVKKTIKDKGLALSFEAIKAAVTVYIKTSFGS